MPKGKPGITWYQKKCEVCGKEFSVRKSTSHQKTCSIECGQKLRISKVLGNGDKRGGMVESVCEQCSCTFKAYRSRLARFCSKSCADSHMYARIEKTCITCGSIFEVARFRADDAVACSVECAKPIRGMSRRRRTIITCACCKKEIETPNCKSGRKKFCSKECMWKVMKGESSPHWKGVGVYEYVFDENGNETKRKNAAVNAEKTMRRIARKMQATPIWADPEKIVSIYKEARKVSEMTGVEYHVDHIVPLTSKLVSGLHVEHNLQILPATANLKKHNRSWPDMP